MERAGKGLSPLLFVLAVLLLLGIVLPGNLWAAEPLRVVIEGVAGEPLKNLQAALAPPPGLVRDGRVDREWAERFARQAPRLALEALTPFGYYHAQVEARLEE